MSQFKLLFLGWIFLWVIAGCQPKDKRVSPNSNGGAQIQGGDHFFDTREYLENSLLQMRSVLRLVSALLDPDDPAWANARGCPKVNSRQHLEKSLDFLGLVSRLEIISHNCRLQGQRADYTFYDGLDILDLQWVEGDDSKGVGPRLKRAQLRTQSPRRAVVVKTPDSWSESMKLEVIQIGNGYDVYFDSQARLQSPSERKRVRRGSNQMFAQLRVQTEITGRKIKEVYVERAHSHFTRSLMTLSECKSSSCTPQINVSTKKLNYDFNSGGQAPLLMSGCYDLLGRVHMYYNGIAQAELARVKDDKEKCSTQCGSVELDLLENRVSSRHAPIQLERPSCPKSLGGELYLDRAYGSRAQLR